MKPVPQELISELESLTADDQARVLDFARRLRGEEAGVTAADVFTRFHGMISQEDLAEMSRVIESGCGQIEPDTWK